MDIDISLDIFCLFKRLGSDGMKVRASVHKSTIATCTSPASLDVKQTEVELTLNDQQYTDDDRLFYYYKPPIVYDLSPREGPVKGGTRVIITGANFLDTKTILCKFGKVKPVSGRYISENELECISPIYPKAGKVDLSISIELGQYSSPLQYQYYDVPEIASAEPLCGPDYGFT